MSTRIYGGCRLPADLLPSFVKQANKKIYEHYKNLYADQLIMLTEQILQEHVEGNTLVSPNQLPAPSNAYVRVASAAENLIDKVQKIVKSHSMRFFSLNLGFSYVVMFSAEEPEYVYIVHYVENESYYPVWNNLDGIEAYPYWNNADPPENVSYEDWEARGRRWDEVMGGSEGYQSPAHAGLTFDVLDVFFAAPVSWYLNRDELLERAVNADPATLITHERLLAYVPKEDKTQQRYSA